MRTLIRWAGDDPDREGLVGTPARVVRAYEGWFAGYFEDPREYLKQTFEEVGTMKLCCCEISALNRIASIMWHQSSDVFTLAIFHGIELLESENLHDLLTSTRSAFKFKKNDGGNREMSEQRLEAPWSGRSGRGCA